MEIAHYCNVSVDTVKKTEKRAIQKIRENDAIREIIDTADGEQILTDIESDPEWSL